MEIGEQYALGPDTLLEADRYLLEGQSQDQVHQLHAHQKRLWVHSIQLARQNYVNHTELSNERMRQYWRNLQNCNNNRIHTLLICLNTDISLNINVWTE